jgi:hypothetical protein
MRYAIIEPVISKINIEPATSLGNLVPLSLKFPWYDFIILVIATLLITAGGYVINDYFDIKTDLINKGEVIVGTKIPRRQAMKWHNILNIAGVAAGFYISWKAGYFWLGILFLIVSGLLYFYSASYKRQFLIGNIIVAFTHCNGSHACGNFRMAAPLQILCGKCCYTSSAWDYFLLGGRICDLCFSDHPCKGNHKGY